MKCFKMKSLIRYMFCKFARKGLYKIGSVNEIFRLQMLVESRQKF